MIRRDETPSYRSMRTILGLAGGVAGATIGVYVATRHGDLGGWFLIVPALFLGAIPGEGSCFARIVGAIVAAAVASAIWTYIPVVGKSLAVVVLAGFGWSIGKAMAFGLDAMGVGLSAAEKLNRKARELSRAEKHGEAITVFDEALRLDPENLPILKNKALALEGWGKLGEALQCLDAAVMVDPADPDAWSLRSSLLTQMHRFEDALASADQCLALVPSSPASWSQRARALSGLGRVNEAIDCYDRALALDPGNVVAGLGREAFVMNLESGGGPTSLVGDPPQPFRCRDCGHEWYEDFEEPLEEYGEEQGLWDVSSADPDFRSWLADERFLFCPECSSLELAEGHTGDFE